MIIIFSAAGCAGTPGGRSTGANKNEPLYEMSYSGAGIRLAVLQPEGINLGERDLYLPDLIQGSLSEDFSEYSAMTLISRKDLDMLAEELNIAESGYYSRNDFNAIGQRTNAQYLLSGTLASAAEREYSLALTISHIATGEIKAACQKNGLTVQAIKQSALKECSAELLRRMGVSLTEAGKLRMEAKARENIDAQAKLAKSRAAQRAGNQIERLINAFGAKERNASLQEAEDQLKMAANAMAAGSPGTGIQNDAAKRQEWKENLIEFETYYRDYHPFDIWFTPIPEQKGMAGDDARTTDFEALVGLQPSQEYGIMQKVLRLILKDFNNAKNMKNWGFGAWPQEAIEYNLCRLRKVTVVAGLFNEHDAEIKRVSINLYSQMLYKNNKFFFDATQSLPLQFNNVNVDDLTGDMQIKLISIGGLDAPSAEEDGYWTVNPVAAKRFPKAKKATIPEKQRTIPEIVYTSAAEKKPSQQEAEAAPAQNQQQEKREQAADNSLLFEKRFGFSFNGLFNPLASIESTSLAATIDGGIGPLAIEGIIHWPLNREIYNKPGTEAASVFSFGGGIGYAIIKRHLLSTLAFGMTYTGLPGNEKVFAPYSQVKFNIMPWETGLGLQIGFMMEFCSIEWGDAYARYFSWPMIANDPFRMNGKIIAGFVLWL